MALNDQTLAFGKRTVLWDRVDRPAGRGAGGRRVMVDILMPYSMLEVDGATYVETNSVYSILEGGGGHAVPSHAMVVAEEHSSRSLGLSSPDVPTGITRGTPANIVLHKFGWI